MKLQRVGGLASERGVIIRGGCPPGRRLLPGLPLGRREPGARDAASRTSVRPGGASSLVTRQDLVFAGVGTVISACV